MPTTGLRNVVARLGHAAARQAVAHHSCGELLDRFVTHRDEQAFAELVRRHGPRVFAVCRRALGHHQLAEDAYQAVFVVLAKKAHAIRPRSAVGGFLYGVARKAALEAFAVSRRRKETLVGRVPETPIAATAAADSDVLAMLDEEIANLSETLRAAVVLCELDGVSRAAAARQLGVAEGTVSSRLAAARKQLAARLSKRGVALSAGLFAALSESAQATLPQLLEPTVALLPPTVSAIASEVMRTMILAKLKAAVTLGVLLTAFAAWSLVPSAMPTANAAPPAEKVDGLIWTHNFRTHFLKAYATDGTEVRSVALPESVPFYGLSADGTTMAFGGKNGQGAKNGPGLTLHVGDISEKCAGADTGVPCEWNDHFVFSPDRSYVVRVRYVPVGRGAYQNTLFDLMPRDDRERLLPAVDQSLFRSVYNNREVDLLLPPDHEIEQWAADGKSWRVSQSNRGADPKLPNYHWLAATVAHEPKLTPICDSATLDSLDLSPDGKTFLASGHLHADADPWFKAILLIDRATGKVREVKRDEPNVIVGVRWSPDGKRMACVKSIPDVKKQRRDAQLLLLDADGTNEKVIVSLPDDFEKTRLLGWFPPKRPIAAVLPKPAGLIWTYNAVSGKLVGYDPDGTRAKELALKDGPLFLGLTPDGEQILYAGTNGKLPANPKAAADGLTLHLRPLGEAGEGTDLGVAFNPKTDTHPFHFSRDGKTLAFSRLASPAQKLGWPCRHYAVDLATRQQTELKGPGNSNLVAVAPDGTWALALELDIQPNKVIPNAKEAPPVLHRIPLNGDEPTALAEQRNVTYAAISADSKAVLFSGLKNEKRKGEKSFGGVLSLDLATNTVTELATDPTCTPAEVAWSPDERAIVYLSIKLKPLEGFPNSFVPEANAAVVADRTGKTVKVWPIQDFAKEKDSYTQLLGWFPAKKKVSTPLPKPGSIWTYNYKTGDLTAYTPAGKEEKSLKLSDGRQLLGMTPDGKKLAFVGISGKLAPPGPGPALTVHLRDVNVSTDGRDTGIDYRPGDQFIWANDGMRVIRGRPVYPRIAGEAPLPTFDHTLIDLATKKETALDGLDPHDQVVGWAADDSWLLLARYTGKVRVGAVTNLRTKLHRYDFVTKAAKPLDEDLQVYNPVVAPDGRTLFGVGCQLDDETNPRRCAMVRVDVATGKAAEVVHHKGQGLAAGRWSPDGRRVAYVWTDPASPDQATLEVRDADGGNATTVTIPTPFHSPPEVAVLGWFPEAKEKIAAPLPKVVADEGLLWTFDKKASTLTAYTPAGTAAKKLTLKDGKHFLGFTPGGTKVVFAGKGGEAAPDDAEGLTLHRRDIGEGTAGEDLGVPFQGNDQFVWSPDGTKVVRTRVTELEIVNEQRYHVFENRLFDLAAKADEKIDVPKDHQIVQWSADGKTWRAIHNNVGRDPKLPNYRWHTVPVAGGKPSPINDDYSLIWMEPSPDGKTFLATGWNHPIQKPGAKWFNLTAATGKFQEVARFEKAAFAVMRWSPDGTRVAYARFDYDPDTGVLHDTTLFTAEPDGTDVRQLIRFANDTQNTQFLGWFPAKAMPKVDPRTMTFAPIPREKPAPPGTVAFFQQSVGQLRLIGPDGGPETLLKDVALSDQVRLSPDGKQVAYLFFGGERGTRAEIPRRVFVRAIDGDGPGTDLGIFGRSLAWSPDGKELAVTDYDTGNPAAAKAFVATHAVVEVATKKAMPLALPKGNVVLDWSRDGKQFLTAQVQTKAGQWTNHRMHLFSREGKELQALGPPRATILYGRFSPDGRQVLGLGEGSSKPGDSFRKVPVVIDLATNAVTPIPKVAENADAESVCWSPDGKRLAYSWKARGGGTIEEQAKAVTTSTLTACDLDGTNAKALATAKADGAFTVIFGSLDWR